MNWFGSGRDDTRQYDTLKPQYIVDSSDDKTDVAKGTLQQTH